MKNISKIITILCLVLVGLNVKSQADPTDVNNSAPQLATVSLAKDLAMKTAQEFTRQNYKIYSYQIFYNQSGLPAVFSFCLIRDNVSPFSPQEMRDQLSALLKESELAKQSDNFSAQALIEEKIFRPKEYFTVVSGANDLLGEGLIVYQGLSLQYVGFEKLKYVLSKKQIEIKEAKNWYFIPSMHFFVEITDQNGKDRIFSLTDYREISRDDFIGLEKMSNNKGTEVISGIQEVIRKSRLAETANLSNRELGGLLNKVRSNSKIVCKKLGTNKTFIEKFRQYSNLPPPPQYLDEYVPPPGGGGSGPGHEHWVNDYENVPDYDWYIGCGPTAAGNIFGYYDDHGYPDFVYNGSSVTGDYIGMIEDVADYFLTTQGFTPPELIVSGVTGFSQSRGYNFGCLGTVGIDFATFDQIFWEVIEEEMNSDRPVLLCMINHEVYGNHYASVIATGWKWKKILGLPVFQKKYVCIHDTWDTTPKEVWMRVDMYAGTINNLWGIFLILPE